MKRESAIIHWRVDSAERRKYDMKIMGKIMAIAIVGLFIGVGVVPSIADKITDDIHSEPCMINEKKWTWLFYDDADFYRAGDPFEWFTGEAFSGVHLDVVLLQDKEHDPAKMWYITENHTADLIQDMGEINMGDSQTLQDFIAYVKNHYPAERYLLSFYDHGGGWSGVCWDDTSFDHLTMDEIQTALANTGGVEVICHTAPCNMAAIESVYELRDYVDVYIGSEEGSGYAWWGYIMSDICDILEHDSDIDTISLGEQIIDIIWEDHNRWDEYKEYITMSAIRTDKIEGLVSSLNLLSQHFITTVDSSSEKIWSIYDDVQYFSNGGLLDIYDFAKRYHSVESNQDINEILLDVMNCLNESVIAECHGTDHPNAHGLSIYFPKDKRYYDSNYGDDEYGLDFSQDTNWDEFLNDYMERSTA